MLYKRSPFSGGIVPKEKKADGSLDTLYLDTPTNVRFEAPLTDNYECRVSQGQNVQPGDVIFSNRSKLHPPICSSVNGTVECIAVTAHELSVTVSNLTKSPALSFQSTDPLPLQQTSEQLNQSIQNTPIIGMGGAGFPTARKINSPDIQTILINACQCEPLVSCDAALLYTAPDAVLLGALALKKAAQAQTVCIVIEANSSKVIEYIKHSATWHQYQHSEQLSIEIMPARYPSGSEKQIVEALYHEEVPSQNHLKALAKLSFNVATAFSVYQALWYDQPVTQRLISIIDMPNQHTVNVWATLGMSAHEIFQQMNRTVSDSEQLLAGGLMMGRVIDPTFVIKATTHSLFIKPSNNAVTRPCIRCGACADVCPIRLLPQQLYFFNLSEQDEQLNALHLFDCIECGCCAYVCPSQIPLVEHYQLAKKRIRIQNAQHAASTLARERFEFREQRLTREQTEREARLKAKRALAKDRIKAQKTRPADSTLSAVERAKAAALKRKQQAK